MSTRYTLSELKRTTAFYTTKRKWRTPWQVIESYNYREASRYVMLTGIEALDQAIVKALQNTADLVQSGMSNDYTKLSIPEAYLTKLSFTINVRSLKNLISLRTDKAAHWAIRDLAYKLYDEIPYEYKFLFDKELYHEDQGDDT